MADHMYYKEKSLAFGISDGGRAGVGRVAGVHYPDEGVKEHLAGGVEVSDFGLVLILCADYEGMATVSILRVEWPLSGGAYGLPAKSSRDRARMPAGKRTLAASSTLWGGKRRVPQMADPVEAHNFKQFIHFTEDHDGRARWSLRSPGRG